RPSRRTPRSACGRTRTVAGPAAAPAGVLRASCPAALWRSVPHYLYCATLISPSVTAAGRLNAGQFRRTGMTLLAHPQAETLLQDAVLRPGDIADCTEQLQTFVQRYLPCFQRKEQRQHAQTILQGKLTGLQRKTTEPIAHRAGLKRRPLQLF